MPTDVTSLHGSVSVPAGTYTAWQDSHGDEGDITLWSTEHYAGPMWVGLPPWSWTFPGEAPRPVPDHDEARSGVAGGVFCGICQQEL